MPSRNSSVARPSNWAANKANHIDGHVRRTYQTVLILYIPYPSVDKILNISSRYINFNWQYIYLMNILFLSLNCIKLSSKRDGMILYTWVHFQLDKLHSGFVSFFSLLILFCYILFVVVVASLLHVITDDIHTYFFSLNVSFWYGS